MVCEFLPFTLPCNILYSPNFEFSFDSVGSKQSTTSEFLMAGRSMSTFPVAMSLIARSVYRLA